MFQTIGRQQTIHHQSLRFLAVSRHAKYNIFAEKPATPEVFPSVYAIGVSVDNWNSFKVISETV